MPWRPTWNHFRPPSPRGAPHSPPLFTLRTTLHSCRLAPAGRQWGARLGKRKSRKAAQAPTRKVPKLDTTFNCPFCNNERSVSAKLCVAAAGGGGGPRTLGPARPRGPGRAAGAGERAGGAVPPG